MAIQLPNPGLGDGQTGDNEFVMWTKVKNNFSNNDHAASRLIGEENGNAMGVGAFGLGRIKAYNLNDVEENIGKTTFFHYLANTPNAPNTHSGMGINLQFSGQNFLRLWGQPAGASTPELYYQLHNTEGWQPQSRIYHDNNTDEHGTNGYLKPSSPILKVESERMWGNHDGDVMGATYTKKGVGHYEIAGTTGLRNDGWYVEIPNDMNGNPKVAITLDDTDGVITLKTYVRIFDMSTFKFVPDLEHPLDIPEGRWIDLRFNDLPYDDLDDTQTEV